METINPVGEVFSYKRTKDIPWLKDKRKEFTGTFQSELDRIYLKKKQLRPPDKFASRKYESQQVHPSEDLGQSLGLNEVILICSTFTLDAHGPYPLPVT